MNHLYSVCFNPLFIGSRFVTSPRMWLATEGPTQVSIPYSSGLGL